MAKQERKRIRALFLQHGFVMTTAELTAAKVYYAQIQQLMEKGQIEKLRRGYYQWQDAGSDGEAAIIKRLFPDAVLCMETALFSYGYSDRNPAEWNLAISKNVSRQRIKIEYPFVRAYRVEPSVLTIGETTGEIDGIRVRMYDRDRTLCDVLRNMNRMDKEIFNKAVQNYIKDPKKSIPHLMEYAKALRVTKKARDLIGVWL